MFEFEQRFHLIMDKICKFEGDPEFSMTDGLIGNFGKPDYVRGMTQACYKLGIITFEERDYLRMQSYEYARFCEEREMKTEG